MKKQFSFAIAILCLAIVSSIGLLTTGVGQQQAPSQSNNQNPRYQISGPYTHKNLTIFLVHGRDLLAGHSFLTLQEALAQKKIIVYETKDVNELAIKNLSSQDVYVQAGDIVRGGDQDRMISMDFIVPPGSGRMPIAAFCVEAGRWNQRGNEVNASFGSSDNSASTKDLKLAAKSANSQQAVWDKVSVTQAKLSKQVGESVNSIVSGSSLELSVENSRVRETTAAYINALSDILRNKSDVIGYAFAINGKVNSADVYASRNLFLKLWPKLLKATAVEALAELEEQAHQVSVDEETISAFFIESERPKSEEKTVTQRVKLVTREDDRGVFFETQDRGKKDAWIHRNYIRK